MLDWSFKVLYREKCRIQSKFLCSLNGLCKAVEIKNGIDSLKF